MPNYLPQEIDRNKVGYLFANRHFHTSLKIFTLALLLLNFELGPPLEQSLMMMHSQARRNPGEEEGQGRPRSTLNMLVIFYWNFL